MDVSTGTKSAAGPSRRRRRFPGAGVLAALAILGVLAAVCQGTNVLNDRAYGNVATILLGLAAAVVVLTWFAASKAFALPLRLGVVAATLGLVALLLVLFRFEGFTGGMWPMFEWRWGTAVETAAPTGTPVALATATSRDFPQFLGPDRDSSYAAVALGRDWSVPPRLVWRRRIGPGWSGWVAVNGLAVTMEQDGDAEKVTCYEVETGELAWEHRWPARFETVLARVGPRATPAIDEGRVYALGALGRLVCLEGRTGKLLWEHDLAAEYGMSAKDQAALIPHGRASSPLVVDDLVVVPAGGTPETRVVALAAFDKRTGKLAWEGGDAQMSYASPAIGVVAGVRQVLSVNESTVSGHDPKTGRVLWEHRWKGNNNGDPNCSQPVVVPPDRVLLSKGYRRGSALIRLAARDDGTLQAEEVWRDNHAMLTKFSNVALLDGFGYGLSDGTLQCLRVDTGEVQWTEGSYGYGQLLRVGGVLLVLSESGEMAMVEAAPQRANNVLGRFQALEDGRRTWNTFALYGSRLLVRNAKEAACYELPVSDAGAGR